MRSKNAVQFCQATISRIALMSVALAVFGCGGGGGSDSSPATTVAGSAAAASAASSATAASATGSASSASAGSSSTSSVSVGSSSTGASSNVVVNAARALPLKPTWTAYYGDASSTNVTQLTSTFKMLVIDADPDAGNFTTAQIAQMRAGGTRVLSYLDFGSCENYRSYWNTVPAGFASCSANTAANLGAYSGYSSEVWMNPGNADYQNLLVNYVAPRLAAMGVDGFMLDNFEIVGHGTSTKNGPCDAACAQGGLDLVAKLRARFPTLSIVLNNAPDNALNGTTTGVSFPTLVDGVLAEEVFIGGGSSIVTQLTSWMSLTQNTGNSNFFVGTLDYTNSCSTSNAAAALADWTSSKLAGFSPSIATSNLNVVCWWSFLTT